jgi:hypothetical protein
MILGKSGIEPDSPVATRKSGMRLRRHHAEGVQKQHD